MADTTTNASTQDDEPKRPDHMAFHWEAGTAGHEELPAWFAGAPAADAQTWDAGIDFEDPRVLSAPDGQSYVVGVMRDADDLSCLSVPRRIINDGGTIRLAPPAAIDRLHSFEASLNPQAGGLFQHHRADIRFSGIQPGHFMFALDNAVEFEFDGSRLMMGFVGDFDEGHGRKASALEIGEVRNLQVLVDDVTVECFVNDGAAVMSTRWFPVTRTMFLAMQVGCLSAKAFGMGAGPELPYRELM